MISSYLRRYLQDTHATHNLFAKQHSPQETQVKRREGCIQCALNTLGHTMTATMGGQASSTDCQKTDTWKLASQ